jgi:hypothetical protein
MSNNTHRGHLHLLVQTNDDENQSCSQYYEFECDDGRIIEVTHAQGVPLEEHIDALFNEDYSKIVGYEPVNDGVLAYRSQQVKSVALVRVVQPHLLDAQDWEMAKRAAKQLYDFLHHSNNGFWTSIEVIPYVIANEEGQSLGPTTYTFHHDIKERMREQYPDDPTVVDRHNYWHGYGGFRSGILGLAHINGRKAWTFSGGQRTIRHEQGHNFGCPHSKTQYNEYGHPGCVMAKARCGFCASQRLHMNLVREELQDKCNDSGEYHLIPVECNDRDVRSGEIKSLWLPGPGRMGYILSTRKPQQQHPNGPSGVEEGEIMVERAIVPGEVVYEGTIAEGASRDVGDFSVRNVATKDGAVKVLVGSGSESSHWPETMGMPSGDIINEQHSAVWHDPNYKHQGVDLFFNSQNNQLTGYFFTHDAEGQKREHIGSVVDIPSPRWYVIDGYVDTDTGLADCTIYSTYGRERKLQGSGTIRVSGNEMLFRFYMKDFGRDSWRLKMATPTRKAPSGIFESGTLEGYTLGTYLVPGEDGELYDNHVVYEYTYWNDYPVWNVYSGHDESALKGLEPTGYYKCTYEHTPEEIGVIDLSNVMENERIF